MAKVGWRAEGGTVTFAERTQWTPTHRHRKGGLYRVLAHGILEADRSDAVIYDDADGVIWIRARAEFEDGRFTALGDPR